MPITTMSTAVLAPIRPGNAVATVFKRSWANNSSRPDHDEPRTYSRTVTTPINRTTAAVEPGTHRFQPRATPTTTIPVKAIPTAVLAFIVTWPGISDATDG
ncbi:MAG: hypothetical protein K0U80_07865 [Actinomycetia bacterium]|nr:hypothetical protein [Actinomycetes bacterium]